MKPSKHVSHILEIAYKRLWAISRLKSAGVKEDDILYFFNMKIRSVLEYCAPIFTSMLNAENIYDIERVQKIALQEILYERYGNYDQACSASTLSYGTLQVIPSSILDSSLKRPLC